MYFPSFNNCFARNFNLEAHGQTCTHSDNMIQSVTMISSEFKKSILWMCVM